MNVTQTRQPGNAIITGATSGLGRKLAEVLSRDPRLRVVLACRDVERARAIAEEAQPQAAHPMLVVELELGSLASLRAFPAALDRAGVTKISSLVCNAGVQEISAMKRTEDGFERTFGVNHLGHFALANLLLDRMRRGRTDPGGEQQHP